jgi:septal ring factor EnvC (AmiA/AmiB activator)
MPQVNFTIDDTLINRLDMESKRRRATGKPISRSKLVAIILDEHFKGVKTLDMESKDLKKEFAIKEATLRKELADKDAALTELQRQVEEHTNQDAAIIGLQNEVETLRTQVKATEEKLVIYTGLNNDLKNDKESLQKQLELVTLRLPPPRVGFWARLFGPKKE